MEQSILLFIQDYVRCPFLDWIFVPVTHLGDGGFIWILLSVILLCFKKSRSIGIAASLALIVMFIINNVTLKALIDRPRPYLILEDLKLIVKPALDSSFPSGHTSCSFAFATAAFLTGPKKLWIPSVVLAVLISFSRIYVGIHWPGDVAGGLILGIVYGITGWLIAKKIVSCRDKTPGQN